MPREYTLDGGQGEVRLLDVFEAELHYAMPSGCHPEDWVIAPVRWRLAERPCCEETWKQVIAAEDTASSLLGGYRDRVQADELQKKPMKASLALVAPDDLWWWVREVRGERKNRVLFHRRHVAFDLPVTDPAWVSQMNLLPVGIYPHSLLVPKTKKTWLTASLSEVFQAYSGADGWHYRLVAGVIVR